MSLEKTLNLSNAKKPQITDQAEARRRRLMHRIDDQLIILDAVRKGELPTKPYKRLSRWWWSQDGKFFVFLRYARHPIELSKGKYSAECQSLDAVELAFKALSKEVENGRFDALIAENSAKIRKRFEFKKAA
jgi:hypothetical protein